MQNYKVIESYNLEIPVVTYSFNMINCTLKEKKEKPQG